MVVTGAGDAGASAAGETSAGRAGGGAAGGAAPGVGELDAGDDDGGLACAFAEAAITMGASSANKNSECERRRRGIGRSVLSLLGSSVRTNRAPGTCAVG